MNTRNPPRARPARPVRVLLVALGWVSLSVAQAAPGAPEERSAKILGETVCIHCHGPAARGADAGVPRIDGQQRQYLEVQLKQFRDEKRRDPDAQHSMWGIGSAWLMDDQLLTSVAEYYAQRAPAPGEAGDPKAVARGRELYERAHLPGQYPACALCHGANAEGLSVFPRLAGQRAAYLTRQMQVQRVGLREDAALSVHGTILRTLTDSDIDALAAYLQSR